MAVDEIAQAYTQIAGLDTPNPMQRQVWTHVYGSDKWGVGLLLKAPTGSGKTEAVSVPGLVSGDRRLIMVYPTRSLVDDQVERFQRMLASRSKHANGRTFTLVVDTGAQSRRYTWRDGEEIDVASNPRRHLYRGDVIVTTLDKFLYRFFGFGEPGKSYAFPLRIHYGVRKTLICFDEAHAYDDVAFTNFNRLVKTLYERGLDVTLMTATMPPDFAAEFDYLETIDFIEDTANQESLAEFTRRRFPQRDHPEKRLTYLSATVESTDTEDISPAIETIIQLAQERYALGRRLIVTAERVKDAVTIYHALEGTLTGAEVLLYHGRLTSERRTFVYKKRLSELEKAQKGYVLVSTSAIEVGCDLNAHVLITQLCDPERLIQRAGRCNRRQDMIDAEVIVVGNTVPKWLTGLKPEDLEHYRDVLKEQDGKLLDTLALVRCIRKHPNLDYRVEMMFDMLYEYVYEAKLENKGLHDRGLVVTRSWEPSLTLCTGYDTKNRPLNAIQVPMRRCVAKDGEPLTPMCWVYKETFDWHERKPQQQPLGRWECAYAIDVVVQLQDHPFDEETGYVDLPKVFNRSYRSRYRRVLERGEDHSKSRVWYIDAIRGEIQPLVAEKSPAKSAGGSGGNDAD
jgi:CRISPR-associated endonuclease/helicase Cas3